MSQVSHTAGILVLALKPLSVLLVLDGEEQVDQLGGKTYVKPRMWGIPKGRSKVIDNGVEDIAIREFFEETGIKLEKSLLNPEWSIFTTMPSQRPGSDEHCKTFFLVITDSPLAIGKPEDEKIERVRWFPLSDIPVFDGKSFAGANLPKSHSEAISALIIKAIDELEKRGLNIQQVLMDIQSPGFEKDRQDFAFASR